MDYLCMSQGNSVTMKFKLSAIEKIEYKRVKDISNTKELTAYLKCMTEEYGYNPDATLLIITTSYSKPQAIDITSIPWTMWFE